MGKKVRAKLKEVRRKISGRDDDTRAYDSLNERISEFRKAYESEYPYESEPGYEHEDFLDWLNTYALSWEDHPKHRAKQLLLSTGGPEDGFIFYDNGDISYWYSDWFYYKEIELTGSDYNLMKNIYDEYLSEY